MRARVSDVLIRSGAADAHALIDGDQVVTYRTLRALVAQRAETLRSSVEVERGIVLLAGPPSLEWITSYLAILDLGHVPLLAADRTEDLERVWTPALIVDTAPGLVVDRRGQAPTGSPALHDDLALLLSTSGSTGSPKLVRLSHTNVVANARSVAASLALTDDDTAITSLPLHYCYGLSILHSHLLVGGSIVAVRASVVDPCFVAAMDAHHVTSIAGVPHTFDLLEAAGPERIATPGLRLLTQAGGRLDGGARDRWRRRSTAWGVDFVVMYGQTEATARMTYLPAELASVVGPDSVGIPVPGGALDVVPVDGAEELGPDGIGELVYRGPNVMMGYGIEPSDLARGPELDALPTGDLGRFDATSGTYEVHGRRSGFIKPFGLRVDLDVVEDQLRTLHPGAVVGGDDDVLVVLVPDGDREQVALDTHRATGLPSSAVAVINDAPVPRTPAGKVDRAALRALAPAPSTGWTAQRGRLPSTIVARVLGRSELDPTDTFTSAGGDSLSYVEASVRLESILGTLPDDWQHRPMTELDAMAPGPEERRADTTVLLRAAGICAVVATHMHLAFFPGGAHLLLAVAGYNLGRFQLGIARTGDRVGAVVRSVVRVAVPTVAVALAVLLLTNQYGWTTVALVNNYLGPRHHGLGHWHFWFIEAFVQLSLVVALVLAVPCIRRAERAWPYPFVLGALAAAIALRELSWWGIDDPYNLRFRTHAVAFFFVLGWLVQRSRTTRQKVLTSVLCAASIIGFFGQPIRELFIIAGIVLLAWAPRVRVPRALIPVAATLASASMWILISHFHVWPVIADRAPLAIAYPFTLITGIGVWLAVERGPRAVVRIAARSRRSGVVRVEHLETGREPALSPAS